MESLLIQFGEEEEALQEVSLRGRPMGIWNGGDWRYGIAFVRALNF